MGVRCGMGLVLALGAVVVCGCDHGETDRLREPTADEIEQLRYEMAEKLVGRKEYEAAGQYIRDELRRQPNNPRLHLLLGIVLRERGVLPVAEQEIRRAISLRPGSADAHAALGILLAKKRLFAAAEKEHRQAIELAPRVAAYHNDLGFCLVMQHRLEQAKEALEEAIRLDPTMRRAFNNLGLALGLMDEEGAALAAFSQAGSRAMALTNMGYVYELQGRRGQARLYYEKALRAQRGYAPALNNLRRLDPSRYADAPAEGSEPAEEAEDGSIQDKPVETAAPAPNPSAAPRSVAGRDGGAVDVGAERVLQGQAPGRQHD